MTAPLRASCVEDEARDTALAALDGSSDGYSAAARAAIAVADRLLAELSADAEVATALDSAACAKGCGWCCHQVVGITVAEESLLADAVAALPGPVRTRLACRTREAHERLSSIPVEQWQAHRIPCPLLEEGACLLHDSRPLPCRAVLSSDANVCRDWLQGGNVRIPLIALPRRIYSLAQSGLAQALAAQGIPPGPVSLVEALVMAFA